LQQRQQEIVSLQQNASILAAEEMETRMAARSAVDAAQQDRDSSMVQLLSELEERQQRKARASDEALRWQAEFDAFASAFNTPSISAPSSLNLLARRCAMAVEEIQSLRAQGHLHRCCASEQQGRIEDNIATMAEEELVLQQGVSQCVDRVRVRDGALVTMKEHGAAAAAAGHLKVKGCDQRKERIATRFIAVEQELAAAKEKVVQGTCNFESLKAEQVAGEMQQLNSVSVFDSVLWNCAP
jgi:hypothetical protein